MAGGGVVGFVDDDQVERGRVEAVEAAMHGLNHADGEVRDAVLALDDDALGAVRVEAAHRAGGLSDQFLAVAKEQRAGELAGDVARQHGFSGPGRQRHQLPGDAHGELGEHGITGGSLAGLEREGGHGATPTGPKPPPALAISPRLHMSCRTPPSRAPALPMARPISVWVSVLAVDFSALTILVWSGVGATVSGTGTGGHVGGGGETAGSGSGTGAGVGGGACALPAK